MKGFLSLASIATLATPYDRLFMTDQEIQQIAAALCNNDVIRSIGRAIRLLAVDGAVPIDVDGTYSITKGSAIALTVAAPGATNIGRRITIQTATDFAHVVTFTGTTLMDGTAGLNSTWTSAAVAGCCITFFAVSATRWSVESFNLGTIAP